jgi:PAS domain S-box-containing protein
MSGTTRTILLHYGGALVLTALAVVLRWLLDPLLGDHFPLITLLAAVVVVAWYAGRGPALLSLIVGGLAGDYFFLHPRFSLTVGHTEDQIGLALYAVLGIASVGLFESWRNARRHAEVKERQLEEEVAARRAAEQELAEAGERLRTTLASIGDAVITTDAASRITGMNAVAESLTGWKLVEATGQSLDEMFRIVNEETRQVVKNPATRALSERVVVGLANHTVLIARDGTERPVDDSAAPIRCKDGQIVGCVLVFHDIGERRRLEKENASRLRAARLLAAIIESSDDAIISKSLDGIIQSWNAAAERLFGYPAEKAVGRHISLIIPADRTAEEDRIMETLKAGRRIDHFETVRLRSDGQPVLVALTISPVKDEAGRVVGASKIARDITGQRQVEERERRLLAEAAAANAKFRATFEQAAVGIAHVAPDGRWLQVNQKLCDIVGYSHDELMEATFQDPTPTTLKPTSPTSGDCWRARWRRTQWKSATSARTAPSFGPS